MAALRALTIRERWAWPIAYGGKGRREQVVAI
jgi:hypothetical protein